MRKDEEKKGSVNVEPLWKIKKNNELYLLHPIICLAVNRILLETVLKILL